MNLLSLAQATLLAFVAKTVYAAPTGLQERSGVIPLSASDLASLAPFTQFARAAYCPVGLKTWSCGAACNANSDFQVTLTGGDGNVIQIFYVGWSPWQNSIVVAHEGTDPTQFLSILTDVNIFMDTLDPTLFPGVPSPVEVHQGFRDQHAKTASTILKEVKRLMAVKNTKNIALAVTYGTPRVGNPAFVQLIDSKVPNFRRINNKDDVIPIVPGRFLGFSHPHGEVHILSAGQAVSCPGNDDATESQCQIMSVPNVFEGNIIDHLGPYEGIYIGTIFC